MRFAGTVALCLSVFVPIEARAQTPALSLADVRARARERAPQVISRQLALDEVRARLDGASLRFQQNPDIEAALNFAGPGRARRERRSRQWRCLCPSGRVVQTHVRFLTVRGGIEVSAESRHAVVQQASLVSASRFAYAGVTSATAMMDGRQHRAEQHDS